MAEQIKVNPTPIQRNSFDVAIELMNYHLSRKRTEVEELEGLFAKYYALATYCESSSVTDLQNLLSDELIEKIGRFQEQSLY
ncbi:hypothetical protein [Halalkalibacter alkalisediminis]|uniref:Uncharacterized protein n=1 Tax=Halalkalibacter alkalisediminis TaxID=935616 RepID=A0ABV6NFV9_9BACI|nr:hypothetical protein [Halalkalibacter alkalisediminis]